MILYYLLFRHTMPDHIVGRISCIPPSPSKLPNASANDQRRANSKHRNPSAWRTLPVSCTPHKPGCCGAPCPRKFSGNSKVSPSLLCQGAQQPHAEAWPHLWSPLQQREGPPCQRSQPGNPSVGLETDRNNSHHSHFKITYRVDTNPIPKHAAHLGHSHARSISSCKAVVGCQNVVLT